MENDHEVVREGWMRKKGTRVNIWGDRYFKLRGPTLYYYLKANDTVNLNIFLTSL